MLSGRRVESTREPTFIRIRRFTLYSGDSASRQKDGFGLNIETETTRAAAFTTSLETRARTADSRIASHDAKRSCALAARGGRPGARTFSASNHEQPLSESSRFLHRTLPLLTWPSTMETALGDLDTEAPRFTRSFQTE